MTTKQRILVFDFGTSSVGITSIDPDDGTIHDSASSKYQWLHPEPGLTEIDPLEIWEGAQEVLGELLERTDDSTEILGLSF